MVGRENVILSVEWEELDIKMADSDDIDLYSILGVSKRASTSDIRKVRMTVEKC